MRAGIGMLRCEVEYEFRGRRLETDQLPTTADPFILGTRSDSVTTTTSRAETIETERQPQHSPMFCNYQPQL